MICVLIKSLEQQYICLCLEGRGVEVTVLRLIYYSQLLFFQDGDRLTAKTEVYPRTFVGSWKKITSDQVLTFQSSAPSHSV